MIDRDAVGPLMREAGFNYEDHYAIEGMLMRFAALVAAKVGIAQYQRGYKEGKAFEREQCAKLECEAGVYTNHDMAEAIRARGKND